MWLPPSFDKRWQDRRKGFKGAPSQKKIEGILLLLWLWAQVNFLQRMLAAEDGIVQCLPGPAVFAALGRVICGANLFETVSAPSLEGEVSIVWEVKFEVTDE